jgi:hypothetical protein
MPDYYTPTLAKPIDTTKLSPMNNMVGTAARVGLGIATGGTSEILSQVLNILPSIFQGITGIGQMNKARKLEEQYPRPEATIAPSVDKLVNYSYGKTLANDIPGGDMARGQIGGGLAAGLKAASELGSGSEAYGALGEMTGRAGGNYAELAKITAQDIAGKEGVYENALGVKANEENRVWEWNKAQPYLQAAQAAQQLRDSGTKNLNAGAKNVFGSTAEYINPDFNSSLLWGNGNNKGGMSPNEEAAVKILQELLNKK